MTNLRSNQGSWNFLALATRPALLKILHHDFKMSKESLMTMSQLINRNFIFLSKRDFNMTAHIIFLQLWTRVQNLQGCVDSHACSVAQRLFVTHSCARTHWVLSPVTFLHVVIFICLSHFVAITLTLAAWAIALLHKHRCSCRSSLATQHDCNEAKSKENDEKQPTIAQKYTNTIVLAMTMTMSKTTMLSKRHNNTTSKGDKRAASLHQCRWEIFLS